MTQDNKTESMETRSQRMKRLWADPEYKAKRIAEAMGQNEKHGLSKSRFYKVYTNMKKRCENPNVPSYRNYGGRGIKNLWKDFEEFKNDMYDAYLDHLMANNGDTSIERIDNNGNYCKENCKWATRYEQDRNKRPKGARATTKKQYTRITKWFGYAWDSGLLNKKIGVTKEQMIISLRDCIETDVLALTSKQ